ncbi:unnamed protein product [Urochloa decumbens]|uniref:Rx N-terminal domain-containing protein n=1 Tax=Urochloa decumbens TaxID=240449 RepID=A0ABC8Z095_9POAL
MDALPVKILESPLTAAFVGYITAKWPGRSRVDQGRRRLRHLVAMLRAVCDIAESRAGVAAVREESLARWLRLLRADALRGQQVLDAAGSGSNAVAVVAGPLRRFLAGLRALSARSAELDRLTEAAEELERLAPGGSGATDMDIDEHRREAAGGAGAKRKRPRGSCVDDPGASTSHAGVDTVERQQRRRVRPRTRHTLGFRGRLAAAREPPPAGAGSRPEDRARTVALAMAGVRRRMGKTAGRLQQAILGEKFSRFSLDGVLE